MTSDTPSSTHQFNALEYTRDSLAKELYLIELHSKDGSAVDGGCSCIEEKHLLGVEALAEEGVLLATEKAERDYYTKLAEVARQARKDILDGNFNPSGDKLKTLFKGSTLEGYQEAGKCRSLVQCLKACPSCKTDRLSAECKKCAVEFLG